MSSRKLATLVALMAFAFFAAISGAGTGGIQTASADCPPNPSGFPAPVVPNSGAFCQTTTVTTSATVGGGSTAAPIIECKWELPDMNPASPGMQYFDTSPNSYDDDASVAASVSGGTGTRCALPLSAGVPSGPPRTTADGVTSGAGAVHHSMQVRALDHNPYSGPIPVRTIELWAAVDHPISINAISDVYWDIYQPCGAGSTGCTAGQALKVQVHYDSGCAVAGASPITFNCNGLGTGADGNHPGNLPEKDGKGNTENTCAVLVPGTPCVNGAVANGKGRIAWNTEGGCDAAGLGGTTTDGDMFKAAVQTGQITSAGEVTNTTYGMLERCREHVKAFYHATIALTKDEPCGEYQVNAVAVANGGNFSVLTNYFDVLCGINLQADFNAINWGTIIPGVQGDVAGDLNWCVTIGSCAPGTGGPTLVNGNDGPMAVRIKFGPMTNSNKVIDKFDACFGRSSSDLNCIGYNTPYLAAGTDYELGTAGPNGSTNAANVSGRYVLCANELGKLDLSIHPDANLISGLYTGSAVITGYLANGLAGTNDLRSHCFGNYHITETPGALPQG